MKKYYCTAFMLMSFHLVSGQNQKVTRIARISVDSPQLQSYNLLMKEQMETAVRLEPGVLSYRVYADKLHPNNLTIVEIYADNESYLSHRETPHFKKYKLATKDMVKSLELSEVIPVLAVAKEEKL